eukprot:CAMPEP_0174258888 /NCGR_PEP_ID=MMETSP0439-20130205/7804_1 /TAXON_ID=0 /ORGANISM="Stereomyxa ramosa, Strain Chinc5" /LENGTH=110 /DNA_ID=CAMNT_0015342569 /DNA_START=1 /DNA_END=330 /DNA_ORIENTATION=+
MSLEEVMEYVCPFLENAGNILALASTNKALNTFVLSEHVLSACLPVLYGSVFAKDDPPVVFDDPFVSCVIPSKHPEITKFLDWRASCEPASLKKLWKKKKRIGNLEVLRQ